LFLILQGEKPNRKFGGLMRTTNINETIDAHVFLVPCWGYVLYFNVKWALFNMSCQGVKICGQGQAELGLFF
jgi:hypothetical protein